MMLLRISNFARLPILCGILYGLSWPIFEGLNLSFLAWFAFTPLFVFLEKNQENFWKSIFGSYLAMMVFGCFSAAWLFNFPQSKLEIAIIFFLEELWFFMPFLFFYPIQRKLGFNKAIWAFPLIWMLWEWAYLHLEFTMGTHLSAYSQSSNLWLIQYIDITGMWGVSLWLMLLNVLLFKVYQAIGFSLRSKVLYRKLLPIFGFMLGIPLLYSIWAFANYETKKSNPSITVSLLPTQFSADYLNNESNSVTVVEQTLHRTDSLAFNRMHANKHTDLYVWPETGISYQIGTANLGELLTEAVTDWEGALLTGCKGISGDSTSTDKRKYVSGVLISHKEQQPAYHHKTVLTPGQEAIPYHSLLAKVPYFPIQETDTRYYKHGGKSKPLNLLTKANGKFKVGVSLCFEQWYPSHWAALARNGADFYTHLAGEGWYGEVGFQHFMANVTRMRCIENRKQAARCANIGQSLLIDQLGRTMGRSEHESIQPITNKLYASTYTSFYSNYPHWLPIVGVIMFAVFLLNPIFQLKQE